MSERIVTIRLPLSVADDIERLSDDIERAENRDDERKRVAELTKARNEAMALLRTVRVAVIIAADQSSAGGGA